jgi:hypothetical protein
LKPVELFDPGWNAVPGEVEAFDVFAKELRGEPKPFDPS